MRVNERFRLGGPGGGVLVSDAELADALAECESANGDAPITLFEIETAAAFVLFARHPADMLLLEVGLGGRLDATNVIERPLASIVTPVSMDHIEFLGDTLEKIAAEKAGIFRKGVPAVIAPQASAASAVLERHAEKVRAPLHVAGQHWHANVENGRLVYQDEQGLLDLPPPKLFGRHQFDNAGTAIAALRAAGVRVPVKAVEQGLMRAEWPARLQRLTSGRLVALAPAGAEIWLDGGHNADGGRAIAAALGDLEERVSRPLVLVVGMLATKDRDGFLRNFTGLVRRVFGVPIHQDKGVPAERHRGRRAGGRHAGRRRRQRRGGARRDRAARLRSAAAHPDHRLALSRGRGAGRERHGAGLTYGLTSAASSNPPSSASPGPSCIAAAPCRDASASAACRGGSARRRSGRSRPRPRASA